MKLLLASNNPHKAQEVRAILAGSGIELTTLDDYPDLPEPPETQDTFVGNALQKAHFVHKRTRLLCVADDSGLAVDALNGAPGVHSKRFSDEATHEANNRLLLSRLQSRDDRTARFMCVIALVGDNFEATASGACEGTILRAPRGEGGFGYDPLFQPMEHPDLAMAELTMDQKNAISHRGRAFRELPALLEALQKSRS
jgi:XTP/dITP diphosphohydrolase